MKKSGLLVIFVFISCLSFGQVEFIKEVEAKNPLMAIHGDDGFFTHTNNQVIIYDNNINIKKTISGFTDFAYVHLMAKNTYTNSGKYEFIVNGSNGNVYLYNEEGELLFNFGYIGLYVTSTIQQGKLLLYANNPTTSNYITQVYSLSGNAARNIEYTTSTSPAYPNPTRSSIRLPYSIERNEIMVITDMSGRIKENILLSRESEFIDIELGNYIPGVYVYKYGTVSGKFIVQ